VSEIAVILISLAIGSFGNNVISFYTGSSRLDLLRSKCLCSEKQLSVWELIPVLSYIVLNGKCLHCSKKISVRYLLVEIVSVSLGVICFYQYTGPDIVFYYLLLFSLFICGIIDFISYKIPNSFIILLLLLSIIKVMFLPSCDTLFLNAGIGIVVCAFLVIFNYIYIRFKGNDVIGYGDIKLIFSLSLLFYYPILLIGIWISAFVALVAFYIMKTFSESLKNEVRIPFGFYLTSSFIMISVLENNIIKYIVELTQPGM
jgi:leader peptidase (prepilin peptidase)/N-methyltransferase